MCNDNRGIETMYLLNGLFSMSALCCDYDILYDTWIYGEDNNIVTVQQNKTKIMYTVKVT